MVPQTGSWRLCRSTCDYGLEFLNNDGITIDITYRRRCRLCCTEHISSIETEPHVVFECPYYNNIRKKILYEMYDKLAIDIYEPSFSLEDLFWETVFAECVGFFSLREMPRLGSICYVALVNLLCKMCHLIRTERFKWIDNEAAKNHITKSPPRKSKVRQNTDIVPNTSTLDPTLIRAASLSSWQNDCVSEKVPPPKNVPPSPLPLKKSESINVSLSIMLQKIVGKSIDPKCKINISNLTNMLNLIFWETKIFSTKEIGCPVHALKNFNGSVIFKKNGDNHVIFKCEGVNCSINKLGEINEVDSIDIYELMCDDVIKAFLIKKSNLDNKIMQKKSENKDNDNFYGKCWVDNKRHNQKRQFPFGFNISTPLKNCKTI